MDKNNTHIEDDFLKKLVNLPEDEKLPEDFTQRIMKKIPQEKTAVAPVESGRQFSIRNIAIVVIAAAVVIFLALNIDFGAILNLAGETSSDSPQSYVNMFSSVVKIFNQGFSSIKITSITITAIISLGLLYGIDKLLKSWFNGQNMRAV